MNLIETIRETIDRHGLIPAGTEVVVGISGGADSTALLHAFCELEIPCRAAHLNHGLRGEASDTDEAFVRELCDRLQVPLRVERADVKKLAEASGQSIEMIARQARHTFFARFEGAVIALAHHADDQVETFLLRLTRGAGPEGLAGMPYTQALGPLRLIRPMLNLRRSDIMKWLRSRELAWREDASNTDETFLRNRVRHTVLPLLERELNSNLRNVLLRTMDILREENRVLDAAAGTAADRVLDAAGVLNHPPALQRRLVRRWLFDQGAETAGFDAVESLLRLMARTDGTAYLDLNGGQRVACEYGRLRMEPETDAIQPEWMLQSETGAGWKRDHGRGPGLLPAQASFDAARIDGAPLEVRTWQAGDRMTPLGMNGSRKLQDIFTDLKVPRADRARLPVVTCRNEIIWIPGYRIAEGWAVPDPAAPSVHVRIEQKQTD